MKTRLQIRESVESFLETWDRQQWMIDHGDWVGELVRRACPFVNEGAYIEEGTIDPDGISDTARYLDVGLNWRGWDCEESWDAYKQEDALYMRWARDAYGARHYHDLWVLVDDSFFAEEDEDKENTECQQKKAGTCGKGTRLYTRLILAKYVTCAGLQQRKKRLCELLKSYTRKNGCMLRHTPDAY